MLRATRRALLSIALVAIPRSAGAAPHAPEPLELDLVRGLGAKRGEVEANVLVVSDPTRRGAAAIEWAPELEWAPRDGLALELEVPVHGDALEALKLAMQVTFERLERDTVAHGLQIAAAQRLGGGHVAHALWIRSAARDRFAITTFVGPRLEAEAAWRVPRPALVASAAPFLILRGGAAIGAELGWTGSATGAEVHALPQLHVPIGRHVKLQIGGGVRHHLGTRRIAPTVAIRIVVER